MIRPPVLISTGPIFVGAVCPHPDPQDADTMIAGVCRRAAVATPVADAPTLRRFGKFVDRWINKHLTPLKPDSDTSLDTWLDLTNYPKYRRDELRDLWKLTILGSSNKHFRNKCFQKDETYADYKHARGIYSRSDEFKCAVGPIFKLIEAEVYKHHSFIKHIPVADRPSYINNLLNGGPGAKYLATDYTSFEALFTRELMSLCEFKLYRFMTKLLPEGEEFMRLCEDVIGGLNVCEFKHFRMNVECTRMSGEMCTSLGNGFSNLMFMLFTCEECGCDNTEGVVEGDDGLFVTNPGKLGHIPTEDDFIKLGLRIKLEVHDDLCTASFCGIIFDPEELINVTDPRDVLATFGWTNAHYAHAKPPALRDLLRAKSMSFAFQYPGCPIISSLSWYGLRATGKFKHLGRVLNSKQLNSWQRGQLLDAVAGFARCVRIEPGIRTRLLVERLYHIRVEHQIAIEKYLDTKNDFSPIDFPLLKMYMPESWCSYYDKYVLPVKSLGADLRRPAHDWHGIPGFKKEWTEVMHDGKLVVHLEI